MQVQSAEFKSVSESLVPVVKAHVAKPIDVVCVRMDDGAQALPTGQPAPRLPVPRRIEIAPLRRAYAPWPAARDSCTVHAAQVHVIQLTLTPKKWDGAGLLGCILK